MKIGDHVIVPAAVNGYGIDIPGIIIEMEAFMGRTLVTVSYFSPDPEGRLRGILYDNQVEVNQEPQKKQ